MKVRADVAELLRAGLSNRAIARQVHAGTQEVAEAREVLGLPKAKPGRTAAATPEDLFWRRTQPTDDGHLLWTGYRNNQGVPVLRHGGRGLSAYRIAFRIKYDREPIGYAKPGCTVEGCVHPNCIDDRPMQQKTRATFEAIFRPDA